MMCESTNRWWLIFAVAVSALAIRLTVFDFETHDYTLFLEPWYNFLVEWGRFSALEYEFYDYTPPYLYLIALATFLPLKPIYSIKLISIVFEALLAVLTYRLVREVSPSNGRAHWAAVVVLLLPTVALNGSLWGQCDVIHTSFAVLALLCLLTHKPLLACIAYGVALAFKLQAVFLFPAFLILVILKHIHLRHLCIIPAVYAAAVLPCWFAGRDIWSLMTIYFTQMGTYDDLTLNAPNVYQWLPAGNLSALPLVAALCAAGATAIVVVAYACLPKAPVRLSSVEIIQLALLFAVLEPFVLPRMHDRYFYMADVLGAIYAFVYPRRWFIPVCIVSASFLAYFPFAFQMRLVDLGIAAFLMAFALAFLVNDCIATLSRLRRIEEVADETILANQN
jgi:Gpi18-like mannosyltransferase